MVIAVKALACELLHEHGLPLSRLSTAEIRRAVIDRGIVASIGESTVWRWLSDDAIRPWCHRSWIFPRDPQFQEKAAPILDLYESRWRGKPRVLPPDIYGKFYSSMREEFPRSYVIIEKCEIVYNLK